MKNEESTRIVQFLILHSSTNIQNREKLLKRFTPPADRLPLPTFPQNFQALSTKHLSNMNQLSKR